MLTFLIDRFLGDDTRCKEFFQIRRIRVSCARHFEIQTVVHRAGDRIGRVPVRHEDAFEAPLFTQNPDGQIPIFGHVLSVHEVVARHHSADLGIFDRLAERREINFMQRPLVDVRRYMVPVVFLIVAAEMFDRSHNTLALHTSYIFGSRFRCQIRIFTVILEIAAAQR